MRFLDKEGQKVLENEVDRVGNAKTYKMLLPEYQLHVDKVGLNTNAEKDTVLKEKIFSSQQPPLSGYILLQPPLYNTWIHKRERSIDVMLCYYRR